jgi:hypothetical protein
VARHPFVPTQRDQVDQPHATEAVAVGQPRRFDNQGFGQFVLGAQPGERQRLGIDQLDIEGHFVAVKEALA